MRNQGRVVSKDTIIAHVWGRRFAHFAQHGRGLRGYLRAKIDKPFKSAPKNKARLWVYFRLMFQSATFKLTAWYLTILAVISLCFSFVVYRIAPGRFTLWPPASRPPKLSTIFRRWIP